MIEARYLDYRPFGGVRLPTRYVDVLGGDTVSDVRVEVRLNDQVSDTLFTRPAGFADVPAPPGQPTLQPLGGGAYAVLGSYNSAFVVLDSFVVVLEAPLSSGYSDGVLGFIRQVAPGKPVRYVVVTHFHYDHLGGIRPFVAQGATILTTPTAASVIRRLVRQPHLLRPDTLSRAPREPVIEEVTRARTLGAGENRVEIEPLGRMPHVDEILVAYVPQAKLLFQGDLFDAYAGDQLPGTDDAVRLLEWISARRLAVDHLLPVHGVMSDLAQLRRSVDRRSETPRR
jgi:glyoxylase-like metal-dependent hydrolase (beta-lactamase superfamily II)